MATVVIINSDEYCVSCEYIVHLILLKGWSMYGSREPNYWRSAYINLEQFDKIYYIQFQHILPKKPDYCKTFCQRCKECEVCLDDKCTYANVAIDDVQLWCEASYNKTSKQECSSRVGKLAGCDQTSVIKDSLKYLRGKINT